MKSRYLLLGACALLLGGRAHAQIQTNITQDHRHTYKTIPTWSDEFNGTAVDLFNWNFEDTNVIGQMNGEIQSYNGDGNNASVANGVLTIVARKENRGSYVYTSARMTSKIKHEFTYGKIEALIEVPKKYALWPAFWMLGANDYPGVGWPQCGEIDILERVNTEDFVHSTQHWYDQNDFTDKGHVMEPRTSNPISDAATTYHKYTIEWDDQFISTWIDGVKYHDFPTNGMTSPTPHPTDAFKKPFYILLNLAVGGQMTGYAQPNDNLPSYMKVDYVRVFDVDAGTPPPPPPTPPTTAGQLEAENANVKSGMTAEACSEGGQDMGYVNAGGFLTFNSINFPTTGTYLVEYRVASGGAGGTISCDLNAGAVPLGSTIIPGTGGWQTWTTVSKVVTVNAGTYNFGVYARTAGYNINWIRITPQNAPQQLEAENANVKSGMTVEACSEGGQDMGYVNAGGFLTFNSIKFPTSGTYLVEYRVASGGAGGTISCDLNAGAVPLGSTTIPGTGGWQTWTTVSKVVTVNAGTYNFGVYANTAGYNINWIRITPQAGTPPPPPFSKQLEAEFASVNTGMTVEACSEGGQDMGYISTGNSLTFNGINFPTTGTYLVEFRVASGAAGGTISCDLNGGTIPLGLTNIPGTGGWQTWTTVSRTVTINAGTYNFGVYAQTAGYNLNWIRITKQGAARGTATAVNAPVLGARPLQFYPNPVTTSFVVDGLREAGELTLRDYLGRTCLHKQVEANERVDISTLPAGIYVLTVRTAEGQLVQKLVKQ